ncbi:MAG: SUF system Fe-S cluster assembly regulator [Gammaproteobacteria bacterium]|nr:SUF system Fe-S cluster assembly regulator [Gammaproteobacteria bacterium]MDH5274903.1 SUF system Fe-S cluster assembly regulator [Gammaproteobacteria bacterium]
MLRISKLTDYGTMILVHLAVHSGRLNSASDVAGGTRLALPTVQKLLKLLARSELVRSVRGAEGGYELARSPASISAAEILDVLEGPLSITECSTGDSRCELEDGCPVGGAWQKINRGIRSALGEITLAELAQPPREFPLVDLSGRAGRIRHRLPTD